jgi:hypothetical protein
MIWTNREWKTVSQQPVTNIASALTRDLIVIRQIRQGTNKPTTTATTTTISTTAETAQRGTPNENKKNNGKGQTLRVGQ